MTFDEHKRQMEIQIMNVQRARTALYLSLLILALLPVQAAAQGFDIGFDLGFTDFDDDIDVDSGSTWDFGITELRADLRLGYFFNDKLELEVQLITSNEDVDLDAWMLNALYHFKTDGTKVPYVLVGVGTVDLYLDSIEGVRIEDDGFGYQAGLGVRFYFKSAKRSYFRLEGLAMGEDTFDENSVHLSLTGGFGWKL